MGKFALAIAAIAPVAAGAWAASQVGSPAIEQAELEPRIPSDPGAYSPSVRSENPENVFFGNVHLHTRISADSFILGEVNATPEMAYRFARGDRIRASNGLPVQLREPLDFLAVSDHAEYMGLLSGLAESDPAALATPLGKRWLPLIKSGNNAELIKQFAAVLSGSDNANRLPDSFRRSVWENSAQIADRFNDPGNFTTFSAYEWSSQPGGNNLHRVVLFGDDAASVSQIVPFSSQESDDPEKLWEQLERYEKLTKGKVLAIPHNSNLSNGMMFAPTTISGKPINSAYARKRMRWEPVIEVTQSKGDSEAHPYLSPNDEYADYESWDEYNIMMSEPKESWMLQYEYARSALKIGLAYQRSLGSNPFKFGLTGSTDAHTGLTTTRNDNFFGKFPASEPSAERMGKRVGDFLNANWMLTSAGLTAVWARQNTRDELFAAIRRKEVYATTGTKIRLRFFAGWNFAPKDIYRPDYEAIGYRKGVPMGSDIPAADKGRAPTFLIAAAKDPNSANLDRVQIVKGWITKDGKAREKIYDVAASDNRKADPATGRVGPIGGTVDVSKARYTNDIGAPELVTWWRDPNFNPDQEAFYYVRVLSIPVPRWTAYDAAYYGIEPNNEVPLVTTERAYSSPIWYTPTN